MTSICNGIAYSVNMRVRITSFARTDAIGRIIEIRQSFTQWATDPVAIVRLPNWLADGHHLDVAVSLPELTPVPEARHKSVGRWGTGGNTPLARSARATAQARTRPRCEVCGGWLDYNRECKLCINGR